FELDQAQLKNLIAMTPYAYKAKPEKRLVLEAQVKTMLKAAFQIYIFQKK
ncbi:MAG: methyltransferase, partial [Acinetobacter sp.]|nr:methyltransferase [Acinetobacter sp.]